MDQLTIVVAAVCWATIVVVWVGGAIYGAGWNAGASGRPVERQFSPKVSVLAFVAAAVVVVAGQAIFAGIELTAPWIRIVGLVLLVVSTGFALWARRALGTSWSVGARVGGDGVLRTTGPYAVTRHPIYTGLLGMILGTAVSAGGGRPLAWVGVAIVGLLAKIAMEEALLDRVFPDDYRRYRASVPALVPGLGWLLRRLSAASRVRRA